VLAAHRRTVTTWSRTRHAHSRRYARRFAIPSDLMRFVLSTFVAVLVAACAANTADPASQPEQAANASVCTREYPTGSNYPVTKCRARDQVEAERRAGQEALQRQQMHGPTTTMGSGN